MTDEDICYECEGYDICYECEGYGDDYYINDEGELVCACDDCWVRMRGDDNEID